MRKLILALAAPLAALIATPSHAEDWQKRSAERDVTLKDFRFSTGETMDLRLHVTTLGTPRRGPDGKIDNAVMVLHGTGGSGWQFFRPQFADELFGKGQPLDISKYYVILPDNIGHGKSSKPSDGKKMAFPRYAYGDMVTAQKRMLTEGLGVDRLELILGTSMGCMHAFVWGTEHPGFARRLAPFACNAMEIAGRNRMWRQMSIDAIKADPLWNGGNYTASPESGLRTARYLSMIAGGNPVALQDQYPRPGSRPKSIWPKPTRHGRRAILTPTTRSTSSTVRAITIRKPGSRRSPCRCCGSIPATISSIRPNWPWRRSMPSG
jgi:homoserine O-acetyltransferase